MRPTLSARPVLIWTVLAALATNLLLADIFDAQPAHACTLSAPPNRHAGERPRGADAAAKADAVFSGVVAEVAEPVKADFTATLDVEESWKGVSAGERVVVRSSQLGADCKPAIYLKKGERYLVYARSNPDEDVPLSADPGTGTRLLSTAEADLRALGPGFRTLPETGGFGNSPAPVIAVAAGALLFVGTLGALTLWRWSGVG